MYPVKPKTPDWPFDDPSTTIGQKYEEIQRRYPNEKETKQQLLREREKPENCTQLQRHLTTRQVSSILEWLEKETLRIKSK